MLLRLPCHISRHALRYAATSADMRYATLFFAVCFTSINVNARHIAVVVSMRRHFATTLLRQAIS